MKTPDEIKKGLECYDIKNCTNPNCRECPKNVYTADEVLGNVPILDALAYIQQLERERDAAVEDMTELMQLAMFCRNCKYISDDGECVKDFSVGHIQTWCWEWRGVQEVE